tara:strand:+ start:1416 stop:1604 length:189 start_codon:yes stop_codon:yes gene_type:complete
METSTLNMILGLGFGFVSFAFGFKWVVESLIHWKMTNQVSTMITMDAEEFEKFMEGQEDEEK